jgi:nitroreductase
MIRKIDTRRDFMDIKDFQSLLEKRTSHRKFLQEPVPVEDIRKLINCARLAPSGHNLQPWKFIAVSKKSTISNMVDALESNVQSLYPLLNEEDAKKLEDYRFYINHFKNAPLVIVVAAREKSYMSSKLESKYNLELLRPEQFNMTLLGVGAAVNNLLLAAEAMGYGACWMTEPVVFGQKAIESVLQIEEPYKFVSLIAVGKPFKSRKGLEKKDIDELLTIID